MLDDKGFQDIGKELKRAGDRLTKIREDAARRLAKAGDEGTQATAVLMLFGAGDAAPSVAAGSTGKRSRSGR